ncbi:MAG: colicin E3/pyocin S6 family cytotoxin [Clostridium sp.]|uniref:colicin E3/pyocin S6 family cytotoxin n=1 Tax=Clostridium sp. TaxID=1506 RepID=UPI001EB97684|nr:colicin E3/pyocin S6 family cytotoxin [Clostridium sp.]MBS5885759.1 hypothetical protein [Clostridium sp.]MDU7147540.1 colicin E3/pyocin S6 family cytotoxin [Clostridium sp.]MDU7241425.1 colicin E3/pyocin S6 family cytotoxin [Clostridium sp.]
MGNVNLYKRGIVGISYGETSSLRSNLMRSKERLNSGCSNTNSAKVKLQVSGISSRIRVESNNLQEYYNNLRNNSNRIDKIISDLDYISRRFREVDNRCANRIRVVCTKHKIQSSISKIESSLLSIGDKIFSEKSNLLKDGFSIIKYISNYSNDLINSLNSINNFKVANSDFNFIKDISVNAFGARVGTIVKPFNKDKILDDGKNIFNKIKSFISNSYTKYSEWSDERKLKIEGTLIEKIDESKIEWLDYENNEDIYTCEEAKEYIEGGFFGLYSPDQIENIPKQIIYKKGLYIYVYELVKYTISFNGVELPASELITLKDGAIIDPNLYHYDIIDSDEPDITIGIVSLPNNLKVPKVNNVEGLRGEINTFEKEISKMVANDRVATVKIKAKEIADQYGFVKNSKLSKINGRDIYMDKSTGYLYAVDSQHGRFEVLNRNGKHLGEVNFNFELTKPGDSSGSHNIKIK